MKKGLIYLFMLIFSFSFVNANVVINEVMYNPDGDDNNKEYIELFLENIINLDSWIIEDISSSDTLELLQFVNSSYALIVEEGFNYDGINASVYSAGATIGNNLNNDGIENITIMDSEGNVAGLISYSDQLGADGNGMSLCIINNTLQECFPTPGRDNTEGIIGENYVDYVIDGDTFVLRNGERVRLVGVDTPEIGEFYHDEATNRLRELIEGEQVILEMDVENRDRYNRLLRYVYVNDTFINLILVEEGYARAYPYYPNLRYEMEFSEAEERAKNLELGMWLTIPEINNLTVYFNESYALINFTSNELVNYTLIYDNLSLSYSNFSNNFSIDLFDLNSNTTYYYNLSVCDMLNNCNLFSDNFTTSSVTASNINSNTNNNQQGNNGPGGGTSGPNSYSIEINELNSLSLARNDKVEFNFNGEGHSLKIDSIYADYIIVTISSVPQEIRIDMNEVKYIDLNLDGEHDIYVKVNDITYNNVNIEMKNVIKEIAEETKLASERINEEKQNETVSNNLIVII